jgi:hypothetical protein
MQGQPLIWVIFSLATVQAGVSGLDGPARRAALPNVVGLGMLPSALSLQQILSNLGKLLIPATAGVLIAAYGLSLVFWVSSGAYVCALLAVYRLPSLRPEGGGRKAGWSSLREGLGYVNQQPVIKAVVLLDLSAMVFGMPRALFPAIGTDVLGGGAATVGLLYSAPGAGALLGALTSGWLGHVARIGRATVVLVSLYGMTIVGFGLSPWLFVSLGFLVASGAFDVYSTVLRTTLLQLTTPDALRGRVSSVNKAFVSGGPLLGDTRAGVQAALSSAGSAVVTGGLLCLLGVGIVALRYRGVRSAVLVAGVLQAPGRSHPSRSC